MPNSFLDPIKFLCGKPPLGQKLPTLAYSVWNVIPPGKLLRILRTMVQEYSEVMHPHCGKQNVVVIFEVLPYRFGECIESRLMTEFVFGLRFDANIIDDRLPPIPASS